MLSHRPRNSVDALLAEIERVNAIVPHYEALPPPSQIALHAIIKPALARAREAMGSGDVIAVVTAIKDLREITE
ncbi:MAG: hypothetical protein JWN27_2929 [Candidatus Eremiobacteraeota bacterium]|nr:hypothetical protein [Candidatus Eremiobacteraeota bacterium]